MGSRRRASTSDNKPDMASSHSPRISRRMRTAARSTRPWRSAQPTPRSRAATPGRSCLAADGAPQVASAFQRPITTDSIRGSPSLGRALAHHSLTCPLPTRGGSTLPTASKELVFNSRPRRHRKRRSDAPRSVRRGLSYGSQAAERPGQNGRPPGSHRDRYDDLRAAPRGGVRNDRSDGRQAA